MGTVKKVPMRQCTGCGEMKNKKDMVRILRTTENEIVLDATGRKNGRRRISVQKQGMLPESSKIQRTGEIPEGTDPGRSIRSPRKGDGSNCRKLKFSLISGWRPEHAKVSAVNFPWRILSARVKRSWLWYQRKPLKIQRRRSAVSASITKYRCM